MGKCDWVGTDQTMLRRMPPSARTLDPLMHPEASEATNATTLPISSGSMKRCSRDVGSTSFM